LRGGLERSSGRRVRVLDSTAILLGFTEARGEILVTSDKVLEEVRYGGGEYRALATREGGMIKVMSPEARYVEEVREVASRMGERGLSEADVSLLALAIQLSREGGDVSIVTSDYSIQNLAAILGIGVEPILHKGIERVIAWTTYCAACGWSGDKAPGELCPRCGHPLKRRPRRVGE